MKSLTHALGKLIDMVGYLCGLLMILMVLNVFYDVVMRYVFSNANIGMQELEWHLFAAMFMFGIGYTLKQDGHVRVDIIYDRLSPTKQAWIDIIGTLSFAIPFTALIVYYGYGYSVDAFQMGEGSADPGGLPHRWVIRSVIPLASAFAILCLLHGLLEKVAVLRNNSDDQGVAL